METTDPTRHSITLPGGLAAADFTRISSNGFGDPQNAYCHAMTFFKDRVYVGTTRHSMALLKLFPPKDPPVLKPWPVKVPTKVDDLNMKGQIWRWGPEEKAWENVFTSPLIPGKNGKEVPRDLGYRGMAVFQGRSDSEPALYVSTMSTVLRGTAAHILRSEDGEHFTPVSEPGLGNPNISTFRSLVAFDGHLFAPPTGEGVHFNSNSASIVMRSADPVSGEWEAACESGFGDPTNQGIFELTVFNDHLYAGTFNFLKGYQVWKTPATGSDPCRWTKVVDMGAGRGELNEIAMSMCVFDGALYVGSAIQNGGYDRTNIVGPAAGEVIRIFPDDSWELLVGSPRKTPEGTRYPLAGLGPGFDNLFAGYIWRMAVHEGWLYTSTFDWSVFLPYARRASSPARRLINQVGADQIIQRGGGFELWRTADGIFWQPVTRNGLGNPYNYGARNLVSTPYGLFLGTANPFGPEIAAKTSAGWVYVTNPHGGAEVWLGQASHSHNSEDSQQKTNAQNSGEADSIKESGVDVEGKVSGSNPGHSSHNGSAARILVTGASGFVGQAVVDRLLAQGERIRVFDLPDRMDEIPSTDQIERFTGSLGDTNSSSLAKALEGVETVYHLAGLLPGKSFNELMRVNVRGTRQVLQACERSGHVKRFLFTSSASVYAGLHDRQAWPLTEYSTLWPVGPGSLREYGRSKVLAERLVKWFSGKNGFDYVILRPSTSYGMKNDFIDRIVRNILSNPEVGRGSRMVTQLLHVQDLADAVVKAGDYPEAGNETFNLSGTETMTYESFATLIRRLGGITNPLKLRPVRSRLWEKYVIICDVSKAQEQLGFQPRVTMQQGFAEVIENLEPEEESEANFPFLLPESEATKNGLSYLRPAFWAY